jgi:hypothetical protein
MSPETVLKAWREHLAAQGGQCRSTCPICRRYMRALNPPSKRRGHPDHGLSWPMTDAEAAKIAAAIKAATRKEA